jgi:hypothetical protein
MNAPSVASIQKSLGGSAKAPSKKSSKKKGSKKAHSKKAHAKKAHKPAKASASKKPKKGGKRTKRAARTSSIWSRILGAKGRQGQITKSAVTVGEVILAGAAAQGVKAVYEGRGGDFSPMGVDLRIPLGLAAFVPALWKKESTNHHWLNIGTGILGSYLFDKTYEMAKGLKIAQPSGPTSAGITVGRLGKHREKHLEKKEGRLEHRLEKLRGKQGRLAQGAPSQGGASRPAPSRAGQGRPGAAPRRLVDNVPVYAIKPEYAKQFAG